MIIETKRLYLRRLQQSDYDALSKILQDEEVMYAYAHAFSDEETKEWLERQLQRDEEYGFGLWAVILKETDERTGTAGRCWRSAIFSRKLTGIRGMPWKPRPPVKIMHLKHCRRTKYFPSSATTIFHPRKLLCAMECP